MTDKKPLLTEESIGQEFDLYVIEHNPKRCYFLHTIKITHRNINGDFLGFEQGEKYLSDMIFDKFGVENDGDFFLKPQRKKIYFWNVEEHYDIYLDTEENTIKIVARNCEGLGCFDPQKEVAIISVKDFCIRFLETNGKPYVYEGEGLDDKV